MLFSSGIQAVFLTNADAPIEVNSVGNTISPTNELQSLKALIPIVLMLLQNLIDCNLVQPMNAVFDTDVNLHADISTLVNPPQLPKQPSSNVSKVFGSTKSPLKGAIINE
ncbi:hypothetical protein FACS1894166_03760 [Bacilli bacterium]|nr:hypothetical protein FACS1894166_03760 [Bacilli bacterium]